MIYVQYVLVLSNLMLVLGLGWALFIRYAASVRLNGATYIYIYIYIFPICQFKAMSAIITN